MNLEIVMGLIGRWGGTLKFFPSDAQARIGIAEQLAGMCSTEDQLRWLVRVVPTIYNEWPGVRELRGVFCMKFKPRDGIEAVSESYPDGLSSEQLNPGQKQVAAAQRRALPPGEPVTADPEMQALVVAIAPRRHKVPAPPEDWVRLNPGETDLQGLMRMSERLSKLESEPEPRAATQAEIDAIKEYQESHRTESVQS